MLVEHRVDHVDERFVRVHQAVAPGEQIPLEQTLDQVLVEHLDDLALGGQMFVGGDHAPLPLLRRDLVHRVEPIRRGFVRPEHPEVAWVGAHHIREPVAENPCRLHRFAARLHRTRVDGRKLECAQDEPAVRLWNRAHALVSARTHLLEHFRGPALGVEELVGPVAAHPAFEQCQVGRVLANLRQRDLVRPPGSLHRYPVYESRSGPPFGRSQNDHGPRRTLRRVLESGRVLDPLDVGHRPLERRCHLPVHHHGVFAVEAARHDPW